MSLDIEEKHIDSDRCVLVLKGRIDAVSAPGLKRRMADLVTAGRKRIILEMKEISFMDSSGLSALVSGLKSTREVGGNLKLAGLHDQVSTVMRLTMLDRIFEIFADEASALKA